MFRETVEIQLWLILAVVFVCLFIGMLFGIYGFDIDEKKKLISILPKFFKHLKEEYRKAETRYEKKHT